MKKSALKILPLFALLVLSCSAIKEHIQSEDQYAYKKPPYYHSFYKGTINQIKNFAILPIIAEESSDFFSPSLIPLKSAADSFLAKKFQNHFLSAIDFPLREGPEVMFGDERVIFDLSDEKEMRDDFDMVLFTRHPSQHWRQQWKQLDVNKSFTVLIFLSFSAYQPQIKNWKGSKELRLGSNFKADLPWLTDLDKPIPVLQFTAALIDATGKIVRAGAEGFYFKKSSFFESLLGLNEIFTKKDIQKVIRETRREDLPNKPLAWQQALETLIFTLTAR